MEDGIGATLARMTQSNTTDGETPERGAVLLVDDEAQLLEFYKGALVADFDVTLVKTVKEAEMALRERSYQVVVSDHLMPGGNGLAFLVRVREEHPETARVLVTGFMNPDMLLRAVNEAAVFRYLVKPVDLRELVTVVRDAARGGGR